MLIHLLIFVPTIDVMIHTLATTPSCYYSLYMYTYTVIDRTPRLARFEHAAIPTRRTTPQTNLREAQCPLRAGKRVGTIGENGGYYGR